MRARALVAAVAAALASLAVAEQALACSCVPLDPRERLESSDGAVIGRLVDVVARPRSATAGYVYRVKQVYRGKRRLEPGQLLRVRSARDSAGCGLPTQRRRYRLFLERGRGPWTSNLCSITSPREMRRAARGEAAAAGACS